ncbi:MAG: hypothetical protein KDK34_20665 [Leptospiraceae bacterium]|nr:hypothetical protein [Leptospiraceae bacterium]
MNLSALKSRLARDIGPRFNLIALLVFCLFVVIGVRAAYYMWVSLEWPAAISPDASILRFEAYMILRGSWPYRDIVSINLPVTHYLNILGLWLFGPSGFGFRLMDISWQLFCAILLAIYLWRYSIPAAVIAFSLALTFTISGTPYGGFQRELMMVPFWVGGIALWQIAMRRLQSITGKGNTDSSLNVPVGLIGQAKSHGWLLGGSTVLFTLATFIKPASLFVWVLLMAISIAIHTIPSVHRKYQSPMAALQPYVFWIAGGLIGIGLVLSPLLLSGMIPDFPGGWLDQLEVYGQHEIQAGSDSALLTLRPAHWFLALNSPVQSATDIGHFTLFTVFVFLLWLFLERNQLRRYALLAFLAGGLLNYYMQGRSFAYHLFLAWYALQIMLAIVLAEMLRGVEAPRPQWWRRVPGLRVLSDQSQSTSPGVRTRRIVRTVLVIVLLAMSYTALRRQTLSLRPYENTGLLERKPAQRPYDFKTVHRIQSWAQAIKAEYVKNSGSGENSTAIPSVSISVLEDHSVAIAAIVPRALEYIGPFPVEYNLWIDSQKQERDRLRFMRALLEQPPDIIAIAAAGPDDPERLQQLGGFIEFRRLLADQYALRETVTEIDGRAYWLYIHNRHLDIVIP